MRTDTLIIGAGHAGLALSRYLTDLGRDHAVLDRGRIGERWHGERWDSLSLLTPNWLNRLPAQPANEDPDGFASRTAFAQSLEDYACSFSAPVSEHTAVEQVVRRGAGGFRVHTSGATWSTANVVVATGDCDLPRIPDAARSVPAGIVQLPVTRYRRPDLLPAGGVLVVGAGPSGQQVARELCRAGRDVVLAVGRHARAPRRYRNRDIWHWLETVVGPVSVDDLPDAGVARRAPSIPLTGACGGADIDLGLLSDEGVTVTGRLLGFDERRAHFADDLEQNLRDSDSLLSLLLAGIDAHIDLHGLDELPRTPVDPIVLPAAPERIYLGSRKIGTVIWATGYRRHYPWLRVRGACGPDGEILQRHGITPVPGLYTIGIRFQSRRTSHFIGGAGQDAAELADVIAGAAHRRPELRRRLSPQPLPATG